MSDFFLEIESLFAQRRGTPFVFNAKDWALMKEWNEEGIPLPIVLEAIDTVFDRFDANERKVNGLSFCRHAVKELWKERRQLHVGGQDAMPEEDPAPRLGSLADALAESPHEAIAAFAPRVRALAAEKTVPRIEERLIELEEQLIDEILTASPDADAIRAEARALSAPVPEKTRERTEKANLRRLVRERFAIPRLSLF